MSIGPSAAIASPTIAGIAATLDMSHGERHGMDADARCKMRHGRSSSSRLRADERDACAHLAQRLGDLQAEAARSAGDERGLAARGRTVA